jgi:hypothetical protein
VTTSVYVLIGAGDQVLYVGKSSFPERRVFDHRSKPWWNEVESVEMAGFGNDLQMRELERRLIETFDPPHNVMHTREWRDRSRPGWAKPKAAPKSAPVVSMSDPEVRRLVSAGFAPRSALHLVRRDRLAVAPP